MEEERETAALVLFRGDELLREAASAYGQTIVMVTHDGVAAESADRVIYLADGRVEEIA